MAKKFHNIFAQLDSFEKHLGDLEGKILELEQRIEKLVAIERNHLIRIKNHEEVSDDFIQSGRLYQDLTPEKAWKLYNNKDFDFIMIDVSSIDFEAPCKIPEALHIPWEFFRERSLDIQNKTTPILIISEDGTNSILACELMSARGFFNCNNISGGYKYWKGQMLKEIKNLSA